MLARLKEIPRLRVALGAIALAAVLYVAIAESVAGGVVALIAVAAAVFTVWNPFAARPHPELSLHVDGKETSEVVLGVTRPVDVEAVVADARAVAEAAAPSGVLSLLGGYYQQPTKADHAKYAEDVETYAGEVREWATQADLWRRVRTCELEGRVMQRNPSTVDADDAGVYIRLPPGAEHVDDIPDPPQPPERPRFPLRKGGVGLMLGQAELMGPYRPDVGIGPLYDRSAEVLASLWAPDYEKTADDGLVVTYPRQPVRHGEQEYTGEPFRVLLPPGEHVVRWEVHASNLPRHRSGTWRVVCRAGLEGEPIRTVRELEAELGIQPDEEGEEE
jgi:hypothetical protein